MEQYFISYYRGYQNVKLKLKNWLHPPSQRHNRRHNNMHRMFIFLWACMRAFMSAFEPAGMTCVCLNCILTRSVWFHHFIASNKQLSRLRHFYTHVLKELEFARSILHTILLFVKLITFVDSEYSSPPLNQYVVTKQMYFNSTHLRYAVYRTFMQNDVRNNRRVFKYLCFYNSFPGHYSRILLKCDAIQWELMA